MEVDGSEQSLQEQSRVIASRKDLMRSRECAESILAAN